MSIESASLLIAAVFLAIIGVVHLYFLRSALITFKRLRRSIAELESRIVPLIEDMHTLTVDTHYELRKIDETISKAGDVADAVQAASRLAKLAAATPVIKVASLAEGAKAAVDVLKSEDTSGRYAGRSRRR
jgi:uncharacterized protein YoxC